jgi:hypothetical protein
MVGTYAAIAADAPFFVDLELGIVGLIHHRIIGETGRDSLGFVGSGHGRRNRRGIASSCKLLRYVVGPSPCQPSRCTRRLLGDASSIVAQAEPIHGGAAYDARLIRASGGVGGGVHGPYPKP